MVELVHKDVKEYSLFMEELKDKFVLGKFVHQQPSVLAEAV